MAILTATLASIGSAFAAGAGTGAAAGGAAAGIGAGAAAGAAGAAGTAGAIGAASAAAGATGTAAAAGMAGTATAASAAGLSGVAGALGTAGGASVGAAAGGAGGAAGAIGTALKIAVPLLSAAGGAANAGVSAKQQEKGLKIAANQEARQARAQQLAYQDRVRQVLSLNSASAAGRGVVADGSAAALSLSNLEGGQIDIGNMQRDANDTAALFSAARRNARVRGYAGAGSSLLGLYGAV